MLNNLLYKLNDIYIIILTGKIIFAPQGEKSTALEFNDLKLWINQVKISEPVKKKLHLNIELTCFKDKREKFKEIT